MNGIAKTRLSPGFSRAFLLSLLAALAACSSGAAPPLQGAAIGGPIALTDQHGRGFGDAQLEGRYRIVYFGFTHCPDVCPTDLAQIGQALRRLEKKDPARAARVQPLFITVDPERDTPAVLRDYVAAFHPRLVGLTGTPQQIAAVGKNFGIYYAREPTPGGGYVMNHSRLAFLLGPKGEPIALLPHDEGAEAIAAELGRWVT
jgi:protein SCO1/2